MRVLVTGATGYIGGRLVPELLAAGHDVVCLVRSPEKLEGRPWLDEVTVRRGDLLEPETLEEALRGNNRAFYLVHSMGREDDYASAEARAAENFAQAAAGAGLDHIVYLGGLGDDDETLSEHLTSRHRTGEILRAGVVPVTELRAATVIGAGSLSFEMLRYLTEVLPIMTTPRWVRSRCQPIAVADLLDVLVAAVENAPGSSRIQEVGGPDVLTYEEMMRVYADEAGLRKRLIIPVPVLSPGLSSLWVGLVTPLPPKVARPLVGSLKNDVVVGSSEREAVVTGTPFRDAVKAALRERGFVAGMATGPAAPAPFDPPWSGGTVFVDRRTADSAASRSGLARAFTRIGGRNGYYAADWAWSVRGVIDRILGGPGRHRGRRHPEILTEGEELDFWKVARLEPDRRLVLEAEMRLPGEAWLEFTAEDRDGGSRLVQTAYFRPRGLLGRLYWAVLLPVHVFIFRRMARRIAERAL